MALIPLFRFFKQLTKDLPPFLDRTANKNVSVIAIYHFSKTPHESKNGTTKDKNHPKKEAKSFNSTTTALEVLDGKDLTGKTAIVTGSNTGIGFETARSLALHGCHVVMACRNKEATMSAIGKIKNERQSCSIDYINLSLDKLSSVNDFVESFRKKYDKLHILILNAGIFGTKFSQTEDGFESTFQVNYLSHAFLTLLLEQPLARAAPSRVIFVSSGAHRVSVLKADVIDLEMISPSGINHYWSWMAYANSKALMIILSFKLADLWHTHRISVFSLEPGHMVDSDISRYWMPYRFMFFVSKPFTKNLQQAASTTIYCAVSPELDGITGTYLKDCAEALPSKIVCDIALRNKVWEITRELINKAGFKI